MSVGVRHAGWLRKANTTRFSSIGRHALQVVEDQGSTAEYVFHDQDSLTWSVLKNEQRRSVTPKYKAIEAFAGIFIMTS